MRKPYKTDLTDAQWTIIEPLIPPARPGGRPRTTDIREVLNTLLYQARTGCQWELLPHDLLPKSTVWDYFQQWRDDGTWQRVVDALRPQAREAKGREPTPKVGYIDSQTVKGAEVGGERGFDGGKLIRGRKRHLLFDSLGTLLAVAVTAASADDGATAPEVLGRLDRRRYPRLDVIYGDNNRSYAVVPICPSLVELPGFFRASDRLPIPLNRRILTRSSRTGAHYRVTPKQV